MADKQHLYKTRITWTGNVGFGTKSYRDYSREHRIEAEGKPYIPGSSDPGFRGDPTRWNPEELMVASISACHQLWYLHLCSAAGVIVTAYEDDAEGTMAETADGGGHFTAATLRPRIRLAAGADVARAASLHHDAHEKCFIANSVNFPIAVEPSFEVEA
jgi:organic hydroperoxide reductase OsmC/OhrA